MESGGPVDPYCSCIGTYCVNPCSEVHGEADTQEFLASGCIEDEDHGSFGGY